MAYIIKVRAYVGGRRVDGEYHGGGTLRKARREAAKFRQWTRSDPYSAVVIAKPTHDGMRLHVIEHVS